MRRARQVPTVSLFPFLSVLLCLMGVLAFMSVSFLLLNESNIPEETPQKVDFQWVGAPSYVSPIFIRCFQNGIVYYDIFANRDVQLSFDRLGQELQDGNGRFIRYIFRLVEENQRIKLAFGTTEYYPLLLVYPDGVLSSELLMMLLPQISGINVGIEPMLPHWEIPYQSQG